VARKFFWCAVIAASVAGAGVSIALLASRGGRLRARHPAEDAALRLGPEVQQVRTIGAATYLTDTGERIVARYFALGDDSLEFVRLAMPDGEVYTLPRVVSASGVRYSDDARLSWWTKGDEVLVERRDAAGRWQRMYRRCREEPGGAAAWTRQPRPARR